MRAMGLSAGNATSDGVPRVLVLDDDVTLCRSLARILEQYAADVTVVGTTRLAMEQVAKGAAWTALILDVSLPDGSGLDVLKAARAASPWVPALIITGFLDHDVPNVAFELQAEYLVKPTTPLQIKQFLRRAVANWSHSCGTPLSVDEDLPQDLRSLAADAAWAARELSKVHAEQAYRLALLARAASGRMHRGRSVAEACARVAGISRSTLQEYAAVTTRWTAEQIRLLLGLRDRTGRTVTIHHLLLIVRAPGRLRLQLERIIRDGTDIRQIHLLLASRSPLARAE